MNPEAAVNSDSKWGLAKRIAASPEVRGPLALRSFLLYISTRAITEGAKEITEAEIGCHALNRREDFDPKEDNIVRVQARHLRTRREEYFAGSGSGEEVVLWVPKL